MNRFIFLAFFLLAGTTFTYYYIVVPEQKKVLPIINPVDVEDEMVDPELLRIGMGHKIGDFSFTNQNGETITSKEVEGKVYVAEYFFTTCKSICPIMNDEMQRIQEAYKDNNEFRILSFTVDPDVDTVAQMKWYAETHNADPKQWHFLTGRKADLYTLARTSFFLLKPAEAQNLGDAGSDFIHTNNFVLVDQKSRIRGYYDGTDEKEVDALIADIQLLLDAAIE